VGNSKSQLHKAKLRIRELLGYARDEAVAENHNTRRDRRSSEPLIRNWKSPDEIPEETRNMVPAMNSRTQPLFGSNA
jgi:hypothetical protein